MNFVKDQLDRLINRVSDEIGRREDKAAAKGAAWINSLPGQRYTGRTEYLQVIYRNMESLLDQFSNYLNM